MFLIYGLARFLTLDLTNKIRLFIDTRFKQVNIATIVRGHGSQKKQCDFRSMMSTRIHFVIDQSFSFSLSFPKSNSSLRDILPVEIANFQTYF